MRYCLVIFESSHAEIVGFFSASFREILHFVFCLVTVKWNQLILLLSEVKKKKKLVYEAPAGSVNTFVNYITWWWSIETAILFSSYTCALFKLNKEQKIFKIYWNFANLKLGWRTFETGSFGRLLELNLFKVSWL